MISEPSDDRWNYVSNGTPGTRAQASTFSALPTGGVDDRFAQFFIAFDTSVLISEDLPASLYSIRSIKLRATIGQDNLFSYDPSYDPYQTYLESPDLDIGRPIELHGAGLLAAFTGERFEEDSPYSTNGQRNSFSIVFGPDGGELNVTNNVSDGFESEPWAIGEALELEAGDLVPVDTVFEFDVDLTDPAVKGYFQRGLAAGRLDFVLSSLHPATQQGGEFVSFFTKDDSLHQLLGGLAPTLEIDWRLIPPVLEMKQVSGGQLMLEWEQEAGFVYSISSGSDLSLSERLDYSEVSNEGGKGSFVVTPDEGQRFYTLTVEVNE